VTPAQKAAARRGIVVSSHRVFRIPESARLAAQRTLRSALNRVLFERPPQVAPEPLGGDRPTAGKVTPKNAPEETP
jgi:hypothetical protein